MNERQLKWINIAVAVLVFALLFQVAGFASPGWIYLASDVAGAEYSIMMGLWYSVLCGKDDCTSMTHEELSTYPGTGPGGNMLEFQIETCIGLAAVSCALVMFILARRDSNSSSTQSPFIVFGIICCIVSAVVSLTAAGKFADAIIKLHDLLSLFGVSPFKFSYSLLLTGFGGIFAAVVALIGICVQACCKPEMASQGQTLGMQQYPPGGQAYQVPMNKDSYGSPAYPVHNAQYGGNYGYR